jgi:2-polyprenyl-6-methoxyphenol hydroxylase-like FAD-dependent oxidoreductase
MSGHTVMIAGAGPTGMWLAAELALADVDVAIVERRPDHVLAGSRAGGFHARTIEVLDQRGVADRFLAEGQAAQVATFGTARLDMSDFPTRHPYTLGIWQNQIERIMAAWVAELPVRIYHGREVPASTSRSTPARRCERSTWWGAMEAAASSAEKRASSSRDGIRRGAT